MGRTQQVKPGKGKKVNLKKTPKKPEEGIPSRLTRELERLARRQGIRNLRTKDTEDRVVNWRPRVHQDLQSKVEEFGNAARDLLEYSHRKTMTRDDTEYVLRVKFGAHVYGGAPAKKKNSKKSEKVPEEVVVPAKKQKQTPKKKKGVDA